MSREPATTGSLICSNNVYALDADSGEESWTYETYGTCDSSPTVADGTVFVGNTRSIYAIDSDSGNEIWVYETGDFVESSPTVLDGTVYVGCHDGNVYALNTSDGQEVWTFETDGKVRSSLTVANETVYIGSNDHNLYAIDTSDGTEEWSFEAGGDVISSPTVVDGVVYVGSSDGGDIYALEADSEGTSEDSRVLLGTLGHIEEWEYAGQSLDMTREDQTSSAGTSFQREISESNNLPIIGAAGIGVAGISYLGLRKYRQTESGLEDPDMDNHQPSHSTSEQKNEFGQPEAAEVDSYSEFDLQDEITTETHYIIQEATYTGTSVWVLTPPTESGETLDSDVIETFSEKTDSWSGMDHHSNLVTVVASGNEPLPWAAVEPADYAKLTEIVDQFSHSELVDILQEICEAVHHVHRYGTSYSNLTTDSVLFTESSDVKLRGVLDAFATADPWYNAPEEFNGESTEQSTVYRIGVIAHELFTGSLPYESDSAGQPKETIASENLTTESISTDDLPPQITDELVKSLSSNPADRHETVLHLRDSLATV